ncbi:MAG: M28 family peptidase [Bacteroidales bacterium]|nr:M28 family peptidase [Bacteroidales bacterium]
MKKIFKLPIIFLSLFACLISCNVYAQSSMREVVRHLSSEKMAGRLPGTIEDSLAQFYISEQFYLNNLQYHEGCESYLHPFEFTFSTYYEGVLRFINLKDSSVNTITNFGLSNHFQTGIVKAKCSFIGYGLDSVVLTDGTLQDKAVIMYPLKTFIKHNAEVSNWLKSFKTITLFDLQPVGVSSLIYLLNKYESHPENRKFIRMRSAPLITPIDNNTKDKVIKIQIDTSDFFRIFSKEEYNHYNSSVANKQIIPQIPLEYDIEIDAKRFQNIVQTSNIIGVKLGESGRYIIIGAHYDHIGIKKGAIHPGANDNASGVAMMLELAKNLRYEETYHNIIFIAFGAEERKIAGSNFFLENLSFPKDSIELMVNLDLLGGLKGDSLYYHYSGIDKQKAIKHIPQLESNLKLIKDKGIMSDSYHFNLSRIPTIQFYTGIPKEIHTPEDTEDKINYSGMENIAGYLTDWLKRISSPFFCNK